MTDVVGDRPGSGIHGGLTVADVLADWPATSWVFLRRGMACVGCAMAPHETLEEVARVYGLLDEDLVRDLVRAAEGRRTP